MTKKSSSIAQRGIAALQIAGAIARDAVAQGQVLRARRRADRIGLHEAEAASTARFSVVGAKSVRATAKRRSAARSAALDRVVKGIDCERPEWREGNHAAEV